MNFAFKTIHEFNDYFSSEKACYEWYEQLRWGGVPICPHCGSEKYYKVKPRGKYQDIPSYRCANRECDLPFTVRTNSIFEGSKVELRKWFQAAYEITVCKNGISSIELGNRVGVSQKTAWFINHRIRTMLEETEPELIKDVAVLDETLSGGKNKNRHADKKIPNSQGRFGKDKTIVFGARDLKGRVKTKVIPDVEASTLRNIVDQWVEAGSIMVTDELRTYGKALKGKYFHVTVNHSEGEYVRGAFHTNGLENFWSLFKRGVIGTHHRISPQHCHRYANEFADRYNQRDSTNIDRFVNVVKRTPITRITYKELTSTAPLFKPKE